METVTLALNAMNTRFELVLQGENPISLRAAGEEALREVSRLEALLSAFQPTSEIASVNARAAHEPVQVSPEVFGLLTRARSFWTQCDGAFDITVGSLMRCWGFWGANGRLPTEMEIEAARSVVGFQHIELTEARRTVRFLRQGITLDLGAIGKGYAIDQAVELLRENGVCSALLHGGTSTTQAIGRPLDQSAWRAAITAPSGFTPHMPGALATIDLCDNAISVSAASEKAFTANGTTYGHVIDPRSGWPVERAVLSAVNMAQATAADVWSTALMVLGDEGLERMRRTETGARGMVVGMDGTVEAVGFEVARSVTGTS